MLTHDQAASVAATVLELRRARAKVLPPELFGEPAWDLLLELFVADAKGVRLTAREVSRRCEIEPTILSRWLKLLSRRGLIDGDGTGDLDDDITLSPDALDSIESMMESISSKHQTLGSF